MNFTIGYKKEDTPRLFSYFQEIIDNHQWTESKFTNMFEEKWSKWNDAYAVSFGGWTGGALAAVEYFNLKGKCVLCPSNTFMATPLVNSFVGCQVEFVDCNRNDLCMSFDDLKEKVEKYNPAAVWVVHIGGHIAFQVKRIAEFCRERGIILIEDCAHAHGASWNGKRPGTWGDAGVFSFYATKTVSTGEGGMLVTKDKKLSEFCKKFKNYGKHEYDIQGLNLRMSEFTAAIGCVQADSMNEIVEWKQKYAKKYLDPKFSKRVIFPEGMKSGYYKYIVFEEIEKSTGKVYDKSCHHIMKRDYELPNTDWVAKNHWCVPLYYEGEKDKECL